MPLINFMILDTLGRGGHACAIIQYDPINYNIMIILYYCIVHDGMYNCNKGPIIMLIDYCSSYTATVVRVHIIFAYYTHCYWLYIILYIHTTTQWLSEYIIIII